MPLAAFATLDKGTLTMDAAWGDPEGVLALGTVRMRATVPDLASATALGTQVAVELRARVVAKGGVVPVPGASQDAS